MSLNSREYQSDKRLFVEKDVETLFQIKKNPEGIPLINGDNIFSLDSGEQIELTKQDKISQYGEKILIEKENTVYFKDEGKSVFEKIDFNAQNLRVNHRYFEKYGQVLLSFYDDQKDIFKFWINSDIYTMPAGNGSINFADNDCDTKINGNKVYAHWGISSNFNVYNINKESHKLILDSKYSLSAENSLGFTLDNNSFLEKYEQNGKSKIKINNNFWENDISNYGSTVDNNGKDVWVWNREEVIINDKKYPLEKRKGEIKQVQLSQDGQSVVISYDYDRYDSDKKGYYILLGNSQGITKEIPNTLGWILRMIVQDQNNFSYITKDNQNNFHLIINGYDRLLDLQDQRDAIKEFSFVNNTTINIKYMNAQNNLVHKHISLDPNAEEIQKRKEQLEQEEKSEFEMIGWLKEHNISTMEQLQKLFDDAKKIDGLSKNLQEEQKISYERNLEIDALKNEKFKLDNERLNLKSEVLELRSNMETLKNGISSGVLGYKLSSDAKKILEK